MKWPDYYEGPGHNASLTCRYFGISRQTFYRWKRRYDSRWLETLEERYRRPRRLRQPTWPRELALAVLHMREQRPRWGKDKLAVLLREEGWEVSTSMVGRVLKKLKERGAIIEPLSNGVSARKRIRQRPYAVRKPKGYSGTEPGDLVEVDTLNVRPLPGVILKHYTARDLASRWDVVGVYTRATATTATLFLDQLIQRMPFKIKAIQVDGCPVSDRPPLRRPVRHRASTSLCFHPALPSSMATSREPNVPTPRSSTNCTMKTCNSLPSTRLCTTGNRSTTPLDPASL